METTTREPERMNQTDLHMDAKAEAALLYSVWLNNNQAMLERLDAKDFADPVNSWIFREFQAMAEAGFSFGDTVAMSRWFCQSACKRRCQVALKTERRASEIVADKMVELRCEYVTSAHDEWYYRVLRIERLRRGMQFVASKLLELNADNVTEPWETIAWLQQNSNLLWGLCHEVFEVEMEGK